MTRARGLALAALLAAGSNAGCYDACEGAAQICADERRVAANDEDAGPAECEGQLEAHAECIVAAESCHPDVVAACWAEATGGEAADGAGGGS